MSNRIRFSLEIQLFKKMALVAKAGLSMIWREPRLMGVSDEVLKAMQEALEKQRCGDRRERIGKAGRIS
jgi:hypothetical protein